MRNKLLQYSLLIIIVLLGLFLRIYNLDRVPTGFFCDEASIGYNAYTILTKGADEYGTHLPLFFRAFGEYKNPIEIYSTVPFIALGGLNEWSTRITEVIYGIIGIIAIFFLGKQVLQTKHAFVIGLASAFTLAISPWHIQFSRVALEGLMPYVLFTILGTYFFLKKDKNILYAFASCITFLLALYSYFPARIFIPLFVAILFLIDCRYFWKNKYIFFFMATVFIIGNIPLVSTYMGTAGLARFQQVSIFSNPPRNETVVKHIIDNYISNLSPNFLFFKGDIGMPGQFITRHSIRSMGEFYLWQLPFILFGFVFLIYKKYWRVLFILITWVLLYPMGSMLTTDQSAQATRGIIGVVPWEILAAIGLVYSFVYIRKKAPQIIFGICCIFVILFSLFQYTQQYFIVYPTYSADFWGWQYGPKQIIQYFVANENKYDDLYMAGEFNAPEIFLKFYAPRNCQKCHIGIPDQNYIPKRKQLFAVTPTYLAAHPSYQFKLKKTIYYPNRSIAFEIGEIVQ